MEWASCNQNKCANLGVDKPGNILISDNYEIKIAESFGYNISMFKTFCYYRISQDMLCFQ